MNIFWLLRAKRWAQNPPSMGRVLLVLGIVAACLLLAGWEFFFGWPEALQVDGIRRGPLR